MAAEAELLDPAQAGQKRTVASALVKLFPVFFVSSIILCLSIIYVAYHIVPSLSTDHGSQASDDMIEQYNRAIMELCIFCVVTLLLIIAYLKCIFVEPGTVPNDTPWRYDAELTQAQVENLNLQEQKKSGARRHCKWCLKFKPDRCHHCRPCGKCVLKMDHHCPWVNNCIGFRNHKYFVLLVLYSTIDCWLIVITMLPTIESAVQVDTATTSMFVVLFAETLGFVLGLMVTGFLVFHIWLMLKAMTTIEFCEKQAKHEGFGGSPYDRGALGNTRAVLGDYMLLWLLPVSPPSGDGLTFRDESEPLLREIEPGRKLISRAGKTKHEHSNLPFDGDFGADNVDADLGGISSLIGYDVESITSEKHSSMRHLHDLRFSQKHDD